MSDWFAAEEKMTSEVQQEFGRKCIRFTPYRKPPNRRRERDTSRPAYDIPSGVFDWPWDRAIVRAQDVEHSTRSPTLFVKACDLRYPPVANCDFVSIPYRGDLLHFEIIDVRRDGESGVIFDLSQTGLPE